VGRAYKGSKLRKWLLGAGDDQGKGFGTILKKKQRKGGGNGDKAGGGPIALNLKKGANKLGPHSVAVLNH